ncbi:MAG: tRNA 2-thiouridine(34) synthase MnmA [Steroidobacteraceae bacterium]
MSEHTRVVVGMSGGVDSAVAALLARRRGHDVHGLFMANWDGADAYCTAAQDFQDARAVAHELGIPLHRVSFAREYRQQVFAQFLADYSAGRTPNPDVLCNREIKFGACLAYARRLGASLLVTGHHARVLPGPGGPELHQGSDTEKDQSYFLHAVHRTAFECVWFPVGDLDKSAVRALARAAGLPVFDKPDSSGICFIGERPFREFLGRYLENRPGTIETSDGKCLGTHRGLHFYTLGQRSGLEIGGRSGHADAAWYVAEKDLKNNRLIVVQGRDHPKLASSGLRATAFNWLSDAPIAGCAIDARARVRHRQAPVQCRAEMLPDGDVDLRFAAPEHAVTPGQYIVLYQGTRCLGGGAIDTIRVQTEQRASAAA